MKETGITKDTTRAQKDFWISDTTFSKKKRNIGRKIRGKSSKSYWKARKERVSTKGINAVDYFK